mmetsp:Transcript_11102/g.38574  ORF Transcript_11102/g.38574 Transcript_11102/m.38574 type:complete len:266 (+) Transcript_11102:614-1411(+)
MLDTTERCRLRRSAASAGSRRAAAASAAAFASRSAAHAAPTRVLRNDPSMLSNSSPAKHGVEVEIQAPSQFRRSAVRTAPSTRAFCDDCAHDPPGSASVPGAVPPPSPRALIQAASPFWRPSPSSALATAFSWAHAASASSRSSSSRRAENDAAHKRSVAGGVCAAPQARCLESQSAISFAMRLSVTPPNVSFRRSKMAPASFRAYRRVTSTTSPRSTARIKASFLPQPCSYNRGASTLASHESAWSHLFCSNDHASTQTWSVVS